MLWLWKVCWYLWTAFFLVILMIEHNGHNGTQAASQSPISPLLFVQVFQLFSAVRVTYIRICNQQTVCLRSTGAVHILHGVSPPPTLDNQCCRYQHYIYKPTANRSQHRHRHYVCTWCIVPHVVYVDQEGSYTTIMETI